MNGGLSGRSFLGDGFDDEMVYILLVSGCLSNIKGSTSQFLILNM